MHSFLSRLNAVFAFALSVLAGLTFCCFLSNSTKDFSTNVQIESFKEVVKNLYDYSATGERHDLGYFNFNLETDFTPLFDWNTKQLFVYLTAEYSTPSNKLNQVVLWDKIILRGENSVIDLKSASPKYFFWDDGHGLRGNKNVTLTLSWNVIPNAGRLPLVRGSGRQVVVFPDEYSTSRI